MLAARLKKHKIKQTKNTKEHKSKKTKAQKNTRAKEQTWNLSIEKSNRKEDAIGKTRETQN